MRRQADRHDLSIAWIGYTDFLTTVAVLFLALYLGSGASADVQVRVANAPKPHATRVVIDEVLAELRPDGYHYARLPNISTTGQLVEIVASLDKAELRLTRKVWPESANIVHLDFSKRPIVVYELGADESFGSGVATLTSLAMDRLEGFASRKDVQERLNSGNSLLLVCGYTDNVQYHDAPGKNYNLSAERAVAVCKYLVYNCNVPGQRVVAAGFGEFQPRSRETGDASAVHAAQARNRRIELRLVEDGDRFGAHPENW